MAQFDVYENVNEKTREKIPFLLDIQNDILKDLSTRVVIPMIKDIPSARILNPRFTINDIEVVLSTSELASISLNNIGEKVCSLEKSREEIIGAVDFLITGF